MKGRNEKNNKGGTKHRKVGTTQVVRRNPNKPTHDMSTNMKRGKQGTKCTSRMPQSKINKLYLMPRALGLEKAKKKKTNKKI